MSIKLFSKLLALPFSIGSNQPFPIKPLSESKNRLLDSESQWLENGAEEGIVRSGNSSQLKTLLCLGQMKITRCNKFGKIKIMWHFKLLKCVKLLNKIHMKCSCLLVAFMGSGGEWGECSGWCWFLFCLADFFFYSQILWVVDTVQNSR